jgi:superfamily I DNA/RNA helicase/Zn-dependent peptidase ImmA (M78 family)
MTLWEDVRRRARAARNESTHHSLALETAEGLLDRAFERAGLVRVGVPSDYPLLYGAQAVLDRDAGVIWFDRSVDLSVARFYQAHELGHLHLHSSDVLICDAAALGVETGEEPAQTGVRRVEGYSPAERREREANVFAREFLLPTSVLRQCYRADGHDARTIAAETGLPDSLVVAQLSRALLTPELTDDAASDDAVEQSDLTLDPSQEAAARIASGPFLLEAGPGTGKTSTLVARVLHLLERGVRPSSILALTFSNKAAEEMRGRVARVAPDAAPLIWMGTFHAFGLELLRKYGTRLGLPPRPEVVDPLDVLGLLEEGLPELQLDYYQNLYDPTLNLRDIVSAISRAKDEHEGPERYTELARRMRERADSEKEIVRAEKALEVARVYTWYQAQLQTRGQVDFGDLIARSIDLLRANPGVRASLRRQYRHVLADEYQDVNRASGLLLRELAGDGAGLWVVGDARQAIYRFRGASPINMSRFGRDFPGAAVRRLEFNYRSQEPIVETVSAFGRTMQVPGAPSWEAVRGHTRGEVLLRVAEDGDAEADGIAREIQTRHAAGTSYRDQAVLCRSHNVLARVATRLEAADVPVLYLGDLFERPEIRDLLALLSFAAGDSRGLVRVAEFPEYRIPLADVRTLLALARDQGQFFPMALGLAQQAEGLSEAGRRGLAMLRAHLSGITFGTDAWKLLVRYLFERGGYVRHLLDDESISAQQQRLAIFQFLGFLQDLRGEYPASDRESVRKTLRAVRRLELFGEEQNLRQVPDWASNIDAVRLMTVHASKGLEFSAVYLPWLGKTYFPSSGRSSQCPPPDGLIEEEYLTSHEDEEECLFFVGLSRARDNLCLSRAERYLTQKRGASEFLARLASLLGSSEGPPTWVGSTCDPPVRPPLRTGGPRPAFRADVLERYRDCPRQYYYEYELGLGRRREDSAYVQFHSCVYAVLHWLQGERGAGHAPDEGGALEMLGEVWNQRGPKDHLYEPEYRRIAEIMVRRAIGEAWRPPRRTEVQPRWEVPLTHGVVTITPDRVVERGDEVALQRLRTGKPTQSEATQDIYALYQAAASQALPGLETRLETLYLATGELREVQVSEKSARTRLGHYETAIDGILRREFPPVPSDRRCPRCPHYFICPAGGDSVGSDLNPEPQNSEL